MDLVTCAAVEKYKSERYCGYTDNPENFHKVKQKRIVKAKEHVENNTDRRLNTRRLVAEANVKIRERSFENGTTDF